MRHSGLSSLVPVFVVGVARSGRRRFPSCSPQIKLYLRPSWGAVLPCVTRCWEGTQASCRPTAFSPVL